MLLARRRGGKEASKVDSFLGAVRLATKCSCVKEVVREAQALSIIAAHPQESNILYSAQKKTLWHMLRPNAIGNAVRLAERQNCGTYWGS